MSAMIEHVVDVTDETFVQVVIEGSKQRPIVVDMWASWCAPCRTLGPILEKVANERGGAFTLAKLDVDANAVGNELLQAVKSQGIPTVVAFRDGQPVSMFIGAYPEAEVNKFVDELVPSDAQAEAEAGAGAELEAGEAQAVELDGDLEGAEASYREALGTDPENRDAAIGLARILLAKGDDEGARALAQPLVPDPDAEHIMAQLHIRGWASLVPSSPLDRAMVAAAEGRSRQALQEMLAVFDDDPDAARQAMVEVFTALGPGHEAVVEFRPKLAARLF